jgi:twitching motility protein PilT
MKPITELLRHLTQPDVTELALGSGRPPCAKVGAVYKPLESGAVTSQDVMGAITTLFGGQALTTLSDKPSQHSVTIDNFGTVTCTVMVRGDAAQARFSLTKSVPGKPSAPAAAPAPAAVPKVTASASVKWTDLRSLMQEARRLLASDLHVVAGRPALFRIAGDLQPLGDVLDAPTVEKMLLERVPARLRATLDADGSCDFALDEGELGRFRVNVGRQRTGLKGSFRLIGKEIPTLASLQLPEDIAKATHHHQGLIVVTGPSGHGKTSTLNAIVNLINTNTTHHVITVEDPIEYVHPRKKAMMSQREVGTQTKSFQSALKGSLREDPDVIVVGELRDVETVRMAISASETGHLVISTMNTPSAAKTIDRLIDLFPPGDQPQVRISLSTGLRLVVSQRLLPNTDRTGVVAAAELLPGSISLGNLIRDEKTYQIPSLQQRGKSMGIVRMDDSLADLVHAGKTTLETAKLYAESPNELEALVKGRAAPQPGLDLKIGGGDGKLLSKMGSLMGKK